MPHTHPNPGIDLRQINARNDQARHIVAGCASALPTLAGHVAGYRRRAQRRGLAVSAGHAAFRRA